MRHVLGPTASDDEVRAVARAAFVHHFRNYYQLLRPAWSDEEWERRHQVEGIQHLDAAVALGKGVIGFSAHFGSVEHLAEVMRRDRGLRPLAPAEEIRPQRLYDFMLTIRERRGGKGIPASLSGRDLLRHLRQGGVMGLTADLDTTRTGLPVTLFGAPALLPQGPARLALLTGAVLIPAFAIRQPDGTYRTVFEPPLELTRTGDREADLAAAMRQVAAALERWIGAYPGQWTQFNPIWQWAELPSSARRM
jgi:KDO2-lipid IV(A) lauroyltransferase